MLKVNSNKVHFSLLVTFCNQDEYISECLTSLLNLANESDFSWEIIVGLDHPSKKTLAILEAFKSEDKIKCYSVNSPEDLPSILKASFVRNFLLKQATGTYSLMLDGDDKLIEKPDEAMEILNRNEKLSGVGHGFYILDERYKTIKAHKAPLPNNAVINYSEYLGRNYYVHSNCIVFRTACAKSDDLLKQFQNDTMFTSWLFQHGPIFLSTKKIMLYRVGIPSIYTGNSDFIKTISSLFSCEMIGRYILKDTQAKLLKYSYVMKGLSLQDIDHLHIKRSDVEHYRKAAKKFRLPITCIFLDLLKLRFFRIAKIFLAILKVGAAFYLTCKTYNFSNNKNILLYYWDGEANFGDELSRYLVSKLLKKHYPEVGEIVQKVPLWKRNKLVAIGSLLDTNLLSSKSVYWGTGCLGESHFDKERISTDYPCSLFYLFLPSSFKWFMRRWQTEVTAVRGPLTRALLLQKKILCPEVYGDPAVLLPDVYKTQRVHKFEIGVILHYVHQIPDNFKQFSNIKFIDISCSTDEEIEHFIDEINSCSKIFSSSLHGIIVAQAYGIPAQWISFKNKPINSEDDFKFKDYFLGANQEVQNPICIENLNNMENQLREVQPPSIKTFVCKKKLMDAFLCAHDILTKRNC